MEVLAADEFHGFLDSWTEYLCLEEHGDGSISLSSRSREYLAERSEYVDEDDKEHIPAEIDGQRVWGCDGDYIVGENLLPRDDDAEITVARGEFDKAREWLEERGWQKSKDFKQAWARILKALRIEPQEQEFGSDPP